METTPYTGATPEQLESPLVQELLGVHNMFRSQLAAILDFANELLAGRAALAGPDTRRQVEALVRAGAQYATYLHHHHHLESSMLFPALSRDGLAAEVRDRLVREHDEIAVLINQFQGAVNQLSAVEPAAFNSDLRRLADALQAHLAYEETHVCPMLARMRGWPFAV
jgi:iron-sulfur cluster repair protein YtfE (RIC family)